MFFVNAASAVAAVFCLYYSDASFSVRRSGWLDRVIQYRKEEFINEVKNILPPIQIEATIASKPAGYIDSTAWDFDSVIRLLTLMRETKSTRLLRRYLRRSLQPSRRSWMDKFNSHKHFPSLYKKDEIYYDESSIESWEVDEDAQPYSKIAEESIVIVSNPVESKLPSAQISVKLLKEILMARAEANREMPTTAKSTYLWIPMNKTTAGSTAASGGNDTQTTNTSGQDADVESTPSGGSDKDADTAADATATGADDATAAGGEDATAAAEEGGEDAAPPTEE